METLDQSLQALRTKYAEKLPRVLSQIDDLWAALNLQWQVERLDELHARIHKVAGSAGSFGFNELSRVARELEIFLQDLQRRTTPANEVERKHISTHLSAFHQAAQQNPPTTPSHHPEVISAASAFASTPISGKLIYLVDDDTELSDYLALQIRQSGFEVKVFNQVDYLPDAVRQRVPDVLLMDIMLAEDDLAGPRIIFNLQKHRQHPPPVVFMSARVDMKARLASVRAGGHAYFTKPININALIHKLMELAHPLENDTLRVLIVDDSGDYAEDFTATLHDEGIQVKTLLKPLQMTQAMDKFAPQLVLINQHLPGLNGVELAQIILQQEAYQQLPVILFSEEFNPDLQRACRQGIAQDYITTQIEPAYLAALVQHRILQAQRLQVHQHQEDKHQLNTGETNHLNKDRLTGLYKRKYLLDKIEIVAKQQEEDEHSSCLLYIKLDNYRDLDRAMGLTATEALVVETARFLQTQIQTEEVLSRLSDDTFMILTRHRSLNNVRALAELIRTTLENHVTEADDGEHILSTCTVGLSLCHQSHIKNPEQALLEAENACVLGQSKAGGNRVSLHQSAMAEKREQQHHEHWRQTIELALEYNTFFLVFQPITHLHGDTKTLYDVLLRLQNPDKNADDILPTCFLPIAEDTGQLKAIDRWVIKTAIVTLMREYKKNYPVTFIVRLSEISVLDDSLLGWLNDSLRLVSFPHEHLLFDIPKMLAHKHLKRVQDFIKEIKALGCGLVLSHIDEQSHSQQLLHVLQPDFIKLDNDLIHALANSENTIQDSLLSLVQEVHEQHKLVIAPFVENMQCLNKLWQCEIDYIEGHFVEAPEKHLNYDFNAKEG